MRTNGGGGFTVLSPRQPLAPAPQALYARAAGTATSATTAGSADSVSAANITGTVSLAQLPGPVLTNNQTGVTLGGTFSGNGSALTSLNAANVSNGTLADARLSGNVARTNQVWLLGGNAGTTPGAQFLGTTDKQPLEFKVNGMRALRLEDNGDGSDTGSAPDGAPNVVAGSPWNTAGASVVGATISGGGATNYYGVVSPNAVLADYATVGGGLANRISSFAATIAGGHANDIGDTSHYSVIGGGYENDIAAHSELATIAGGVFNNIGTNSWYAAIGGGYDNDIAHNSRSATIAGGEANELGAHSRYGSIGGGYNNSIYPNSAYATIPGGYYNSATDYAFAAGTLAKANHTGAFVWADPTGLAFSSTATNQFLIRATGNVGINKNNPATALDVNGTVTATSFSGSGAGLTGLSAGSLSGTVADARLSANVPLLSAGKLADSVLSANVALLNGSQTFTGAKSFSSPIHLNNGDIFFRSSADENHGIGWFGFGKEFAGVNLDGPVLYGCDGGGLGTRCNTNLALRWKGDGNVAIDPRGLNNGALLPGLTFGNGSGEGIASKRTAGGNQYGLDFYANSSARLSITQNGYVGIGTTTPESLLDVNGTVTLNRLMMGGCTNNGNGATALGYGTTANGAYSLAQGYDTVASAQYCVAAGRGARALHYGTFVWGDANAAEIASTVINSVTMRASGGYRLFSNSSATAGVSLAPGSGSWTSLSDRNAKENLTPVNASDVLEKVAALPLATWNYRSQDATTRHIGPMAQDFKAAFGVGESETGITTIDADGVALAAIQGLNQKLTEALKRRDAENAELKQRLERLEELMARQPGGAR